MLNNETIQEVYTGEVRAARHHVTLVSSAIGSCIAVVVVDREKRTGGIAHVMLPGSADRDRWNYRFRFAENGIDELLRQMDGLGSGKADLIAVLAGGGNVLRRPDDRICAMNIRSVLEILGQRGVPVAASSLGGTKRRKVRLDLATCSIFHALGDGGEELLWLPASGSQADVTCAMAT
jgi:chemotaxis protein CheD